MVDLKLLPGQADQHAKYAATLSTSIADLVAQKTQADADLVDLKRQLAAAKATLTGLQTQNATLTTQLGTANQTIKQQQDAAAASTVQIKDLTTRLAAHEDTPEFKAALRTKLQAEKAAADSISKTKADALAKLGA